MTCSGPHRCPRWCCHARWGSDRSHGRTRWSFGAELDVLRLPLQIHSPPSCCGGISGLPALSRPSSLWSGLWTCSPQLLPSVLCVGLGDQALLVPPTRATLCEAPAGWRGKRELVSGSLSPSKWTDGPFSTCMEREAPGSVFSFPVLGGHSCCSI